VVNPVVKVNVIFGTESGNAELTADDIAEVLSARFQTSVQDMQDVDVEQIDADAFYIVVCSTYGEGELPATAQPFHAALSAARPDLSALRYAVFGRGDSTYTQTYSHGSEIIDVLLRELGATRLGEYGRHDAADWNQPEDVAQQWAQRICPEIEYTLHKSGAR